MKIIHINEQESHIYHNNEHIGFMICWTDSNGEQWFRVQIHSYQGIISRLSQSYAEAYDDILDLLDREDV